MLVGGAGFIGHNLSLELARMGASVMIVDNLMVNNLIENAFVQEKDPVQRVAYQNLRERFSLLRSEGVELRNADARLLADLGDALKNSCQQVVHMAAIASAVDAKKEPGLSFDLQLIRCEMSLNSFDLKSTRSTRRCLCRPVRSMAISKGTLSTKRRSRAPRAYM